MTEVTHGMDVGIDIPEGTEMPDGFELGDGVRRDSRCVAKWEDCESGEYNPYCCRFPKSCSANSVRNRVYKAGILEPPSMRVITEGPGLSYGNQPHGSVSITLSEQSAKELQRLRKHYVDAERSETLRAWVASNQGGELDTSVYNGWRAEAEARWASEFPQLAVLLQEAQR